MANEQAELAGNLGEELEAGLAELPPERQAALREAALRFASMSEDERAEVRAAAEREMLDHQADQVCEAAVDAWRRGRTAALLPRLAEAAAAFSEGQAPDSPQVGLASFIDAVSHLLRGEPAPPIPPAYAGRLAILEAALARD